MKIREDIIICGIGKTLFNSSVCHFPLNAPEELMILLTERLTRQKASGAWPEVALKESAEFERERLLCFDNRDVNTPKEVEAYYNQRFPFYEKVESLGLNHFLHHSNPEIQSISHHLAHAYAALYMSPFEKALIVVMDGAGSRMGDFKESPEFQNHSAPTEQHLEEYSVYQMEAGKIEVLEKNWQLFQKDENNPPHYYSEGVGSFYEKCAEYIFNSKRAAGKVMGLAAFGTPMPCSDPVEFLSQLDWGKSFRGEGEKTKEQWEQGPYQILYQDIAATAQAYYEKVFLERLETLKVRYPQDNIILTGGCALNCVANSKVVEKQIFSSVYVPPFPGDECISLGCASYGAYQSGRIQWRPRKGIEQHGYLGSKINIPTTPMVEQIFPEYEVIESVQVEADTVKLLKEGEIIAWYQGRAESGPRALGNRSLLVDPTIPGIKERLNREIKFRESFRPYGCSVNLEKAQLYFDLPEGVTSPYMSFAVKVKNDLPYQLEGITHVDGTSRIQTVTEDLNRRFHRLIDLFGEETGVYALLNTSLNIMGEPIVESLQDLKHFMDNSSIQTAVAGHCLIRKKN